jgi:phenylacetate 2-hydroxylase
MLTIL